MRPTEQHARIGAIVANLATWMAVGGLCSYVQAADGTALPVPHEQVVVSLPVFIGGIVATAGFTWVVAQWDRRRTDEVVKLREQVEQLTNKLGGGK